MIVYVFFSFCILFSTQAHDYGENLPNTRIMNGEPAKPGEFPYQVSLQNIRYSTHFCGGSIVNKDYVITAAHCVVYKKELDIKIVAGTLSLRKPKTTHYVEKIIAHKKYNPLDSWKNDIALIKVKTPFIFNQEINIIPLPASKMTISANQKATVIGWGSLRPEGSAFDYLQKAEIIIADQEFCAEAYKTESLDIYNSHICAYDPNIPRGACFGDSGGPLIVKGILVGIVSWAHDCAQIDFPSVYTRVTEFLDWLHTNM